MTRTIRILFLSANPDGTTELKVLEECKLIDARIQASAYREEFRLEQMHAASLMELQTHLLRFKPNIVHFSGHGSEKGGLIFENYDGSAEEAPPNALSTLFRIINEGASAGGLQDNRIHCVVLSACYSIKQAKAIAQYVDCVIGISDAIKDDSATNFAASFYQALGFGQSVQTSFDLGRNQLELADDADESILNLEHKPEIDPSKIFLAGPSTASDSAETKENNERRKRNLLEHCNKIIKESDLERGFHHLQRVDINKDYSEYDFEINSKVYKYGRILIEHLYTGQKTLYDSLIEVKDLWKTEDQMIKGCVSRIREPLRAIVNNLGIETVDSSFPGTSHPILPRFESLVWRIIAGAETLPLKMITLAPYNKSVDELRWELRWDDESTLCDLRNMPNEEIGKRLAGLLNDFVSESRSQFEPLYEIQRKFSDADDRFRRGFEEFFSNITLGTASLGGGCTFCLTTDFHSEGEITRMRAELAKLHTN